MSNSAPTPRPSTPAPPRTIPAIRPADPVSARCDGAGVAITTTAGVPTAVAGEVPIAAAGGVPTAGAGGVGATAIAGDGRGCGRGAAGGSGTVTTTLLLRSSTWARMTQLTRFG